MEIRVIEPFFTNHSFESPNEYKSEFTTKLLCGPGSIQPVQSLLKNPVVHLNVRLLYFMCASVVFSMGDITLSQS